MKTFFLFFLALYLFPIHTHAHSIDLGLNPQSLAKAIGPVSKRSGLRPDIETFIKAEAAGSSLKYNALTQLAQDYQETLAHILDETQAVSAAKKIVHSEFCVRYAFPDRGYYEASKLHGMILNTYALARIGIRINSYMAKAYPYLPKESLWIQDCRFMPSASAQQNGGA